MPASESEPLTIHSDCAVLVTYSCIMSFLEVTKLNMSRKLELNALLDFLVI